MAHKGKKIFLTGASMGIGEAIAETLAREGATLFLFSRSQDKLQALTTRLQSENKGADVFFEHGDIQDHKVVMAAVDAALHLMGGIDVLINNAGLALGAPKPFHELSVDQIDQMNGTNISGMMYATHAILNAAFIPKNEGTILNISSITALAAPPFPGEVVYHANKAGVEGFSNAIRNELVGKDIKVLVVRPGPVGNHFHQQRVGFDQKQYDDFFDGYDPLESSNIADAVSYMLSQPLQVSVTAMDVVPTAVRSLNVLDREWNSRHK